MQELSPWKTNESAGKSYTWKNNPIAMELITLQPFSILAEVLEKNGFTLNC